jgi:ubiquinone/menaquinone biosynthesis C-methylase UbiE
MNVEDKNVYDRRWAKSSGTKDEDILAMRNPGTQVSFFYYHYNRFITSQLQKHFSELKGKRLLELGCGRGTSSIYQAVTHGLEVVPTDYSEGAVAIANRNMGKYGVPGRAVQADIFNLPFPSGSFDVVISLGVMEHIAQAADAYREMHRMLRPGGVMLSMNVPEKPDNIQRVAAPLNRILISIKNAFALRDNKPWLDPNSRSKTADVHRSTMTGSMFAEMARQGGFENVEIFEVNPFPTVDPLPKWGDWLVTRLYFLALWLRKHIGRVPEPFLSSIDNSRAHFLVSVK